ncbi:MAG: phosphate ABC transporter substrate-binding protein [Defluviitaleaceae bacterium]|nr:phosphate ABC transporter substrate-binding protein [Defluviitaleaceae bacterium]
MKKILPLIFTALAVIFAGCAKEHHEAVIVAGSTSVQPYAEVLAEAFAHIRPDILVDIQGGGSSAGIMAVDTSVADIGMSSRLLKDSEKWMWHVEFARDGLAIILHPDNPVENFTIEQLRGIYAAEITNWKDLGGKDARIHVITREEGSGTRAAFEELVMDGKFITPRAIVQASNGAVRQLVSNDKNSIGFISLGLVDRTVKAASLGGVAASRENITDESYSLYRPFLFITNGAPEGDAKIFIDFALSPEGQRILSLEGLVEGMNP